MQARAHISLGLQGRWEPMSAPHPTQRTLVPSEIPVRLKDLRRPGTSDLAAETLPSV